MSEVFYIEDLFLDKDEIKKEMSKPGKITSLPPGVERGRISKDEIENFRLTFKDKI